jgi:tetraacyldisaccharide 4'-kinase
VENLAGSVAGRMAFDDHHRYTETDFQRIMDQSRQCAADCLVTTEKDYVKIAGRFQNPMDMVVIGIRMRFIPDDRAFSKWIMKKMRQRGGPADDSPGRFIREERD